MSKQLILNLGLEDYENIILDIFENESFEKIIPHLYIISPIKKINLKVEKDINYILNGLNLEVEDERNLKKVAILIQKYCEEYKSYKYFKDIGKELGNNFKKLLI